MLLLLVALAPALVIGLYFYIRDKYEREPPGLLLLCFLAGGIITIAAIQIGNFLIEIPVEENYFKKLLFHSFIIAGLNEELLKYLVFLLLIWKNKNFNEKFDGIVYAVFISLGFAAVENVFYVMEGGFRTGIVRAITAVPGHAMDGVLMGYFFSQAKFNQKRKISYLLLALFIPWMIHGIWDTLVFLIREGKPIGWSIGLTLWLFIAFFFLLYQLGMKQINKLIESSPFKDRKNKDNKN